MGGGLHSACSSPSSDSGREEALARPPFALLGYPSIPKFLSRDPLMTTQIPHFIDGKRSNLASTRTADVMNPSTGQVQAQVLMASAADVDTAVASAVEAQKEWAAWN